MSEYSVRIWPVRVELNTLTRRRAWVVAGLLTEVSILVILASAHWGHYWLPLLLVVLPTGLFDSRLLKQSGYRGLTDSVFRKASGLSAPILIGVAACALVLQESPVPISTLWLKSTGTLVVFFAMYLVLSLPRMLSLWRLDD